MRKVIAVDVDGTLLRYGKPNKKIIDYIKKQHSEGYTMLLWSARGKDHAEKAAVKCGIDKLFQVIISKPSFIIDDKGWSWIKYTRRIKNFKVTL